MTTATTATATSMPPPWHAAYPLPRNSPATISREEVLGMIKRSVENPNRDYVLVDLRRNDFEVKLTGTLQTPMCEADRARAVRSDIQLIFPHRACTLPYPPYTRSSKTQASAKSSGIVVCSPCPFQSSRSPTNPPLQLVHRTNQLLCTLASSKGRGNRAAGWFADYITDQGDDQMESLALAEGVKGWATAGPDYVQHMIEYDANSWL